MIGKKLSINGYPMTIVGVSQAGFRWNRPSERGADPRSDHDDGTSSYLGNDDHLKARRFRWVKFRAIEARRDPEQAKAGLQPLFHQMLEMEVQQKEFAKAAPHDQGEIPEDVDRSAARVEGRSESRQQFSNPLLVLTAIVALVLLIACANVANLLDRARDGAAERDRGAAGAGRGAVRGSFRNCWSRACCWR